MSAPHKAGGASSKKKKKFYPAKEPLRPGTVEVTERAPLEDHEIAPELRLARRLAHNDVSVRERSVKVLRRWLAKREVVTELELQKIFKGLFYCYWMSDKQKVQMELAQRIVDLTTSLPEERLVLFVKVYYDTLIREWGGIDRIRMDKYMSFVRKMVHATWRYLQAKDWNIELVTKVTDVLSQSVLSGARTDCRGIPFESFQRLLAPFYTSLCSIIDKTLIRRVNDNVMTPIMNTCRAVGGHDEVADDFPYIALLPVLDGHVADMMTHMFTLASSSTTIDKQRAVLYRYHADFKACTSPAIARPARVVTAPVVAAIAPAESKAEKKRSKKAAKAASVAADSATSVDETDDNDNDTPSIAASAVVASSIPKLGKRKQASSSMETQSSAAEAAAETHAVPLDAYLLKKVAARYTKPSKSSTSIPSSSAAAVPVAASAGVKKPKVDRVPAKAAAATVPVASSAAATVTAPAPASAATPRTARKNSVRWAEDINNVKEFHRFNPTSPGETTTTLLGKSPAKTNLKPATPVLARSKRVVISTPPSASVAAAAAHGTAPPQQPRAQDYFMKLTSP